MPDVNDTMASPQPPPAAQPMQTPAQNQPKQAQARAKGGYDKLSLAIFLIIAIILIAIIVAFHTSSSGNALLNALVAQKGQISASQAANIISYDVGKSSSVNLGYSGTMNLILTGGPASEKVSLPYTLAYQKNGSASRGTVSITYSGQSPSTLSPAGPGSATTAITINFSYVKANGHYYICSNLFAQTYAASSTYNVSCIADTTLQLMQSAGSQSVASSGLAGYMGILQNSTDSSSSKLNLTVTSVQRGSYKGSPCINVSGDLTGYFNITALDVLSSLTSSFSGSSQNVSAITLSGNYTACLSSANGNLPLTSTQNIKVNNFAGLDITIYNTLSATSIGNPAPSPSQISMLPGRLLNLTTLLPSTCQSSYNYNPLYGICQNATLSTSGALRVAYAPISVQSSVRVLGLACKPYNFTPSTSFYSAPTPPPSSAFIPVNISMPTTLQGGYATGYYTSPTYSTTPLYFNCPLNSTAIGTAFDGDLWAYYTEGGVANVSEVATIYGYSTTNANLGTNTNSGTVNPLPSQLSTAPSSSSSRASQIAAALNYTSPPLIVLDSNANPGATMIVVGTQYDNTIANQIFQTSGIAPISGGIVQGYGTNRILVSGYTDNEAIQAAEQFDADLDAASTGKGTGVVFSDIPVIDLAGQPVVQIVIGSGATAGEVTAAEEIAATLVNLSASGTVSLNSA